MTSGSTTSRRDSIERITRENAFGNPISPPHIASASPFHEILVSDIAAALPEQLRSRVSTTMSIDEVMDWVAAGSMLQWVTDTRLRGVFLGELGRDPKRASLALAKAASAEMEPPARDQEWRRADGIGLVMQFGVAMGVLMMRCVISSIFGEWLTGHEFHAEWAVTLSAGLFDLPVFVASIRSGVVLPVYLVLTGLWHVIEIRLADTWMENVRQGPARARGLPPPRSWRVDGFRAAWFINCLLLWLAAAAICLNWSVTGAGGVWRLLWLAPFAASVPVFLTALRALWKNDA